MLVGYTLITTNLELLLYKTVFGSFTAPSLRAFLYLTEVVMKSHPFSLSFSNFISSYTPSLDAFSLSSAFWLFRPPVVLGTS